MALIILTLLAFIHQSQATRSAPDIGVCDTIVNKTSVILDCLSGSDNFCCKTEKLITWNHVTRWGKRCCSESEFVLQNM